MGDPIGDFFSHELSDLANYIRSRLAAAGLSMLDGEVYQIETFLLQRLHVPQPIVLIEEIATEIETKGVHRVLVEKLQTLAAPTVNPIKAWKVHKRNLSHFTETYPKLAAMEVQNLTSTSEFSGPAAQQLIQSIEDEIAKAEALLKSMYDSSAADDNLLNEIDTIIEDTAKGIEVVGGPGIIISIGLFITAIAQGGLDVFNDVLDALAALSTGEIVAGVLAAAAIAVGIALFIWIQSQQRLQNAPSKTLKPGASPTPVAVPTPTNQGLTRQQQQEVEDVLANIGITGISKFDIEHLVKLGYSAYQILAMLKLWVKNSGLSQGPTLTNLINTELANMVAGIEKTQRTGLPFGFKSLEDFQSFGTKLQDGLKTAGYTGVTAILRGSAITGVKYTTGATFDAGRESDFDLALVSPELLARAKALGIPLIAGGRRTVPLNGRQLIQLGLYELSQQLTQLAGRKVSFMIYDTIKTVIARGASITIPSK